MIALGGWLPVSTGAEGRAAAAVHQQVVAFYVPWDDASRTSLVRHIGQIDWLVPVLATVNGFGLDNPYQRTGFASFDVGARTKFAYGDLVLAVHATVEYIKSKIPPMFATQLDRLLEGGDS